MREKLLNRFHLIILAAFLIPAVTIAAVYAGLGFYPFGDGEKSVLIMDMADQYAEFFSSLRYAFGGDNSLLFSWSRSMGGNFMGLFAYYIASPFSFLTIFFSVENLPVALFLLTILKTGLCGMTFALYLEHTWYDKKGKWVTLFFSCCYALMSYAVVYGMCLMWLDGLILFPLILLGIEKLIRGTKGIVFLLSLAAAFICNYYTAYMIGIFSAMYLVYRALCTYSKEQWKNVLLLFAKFAGNTILAFGISAPLILPTIYDLTSGKLAMEQFVPEETHYFEFWYLIKRLFGGEYDGITNGGLPSIFCGTVVLVLVVLFFFMRKINWKEKLGAALIFTILVFSFWNVKLDMAWHGFQYPSWFPYRYAFVFSTFMLIVANRAFMEFKVGEHAAKRLAKPVVLYLTFIIVLFQYLELYNNAKENIVGLDSQFGYKKIEDYRAFVRKYQPIVEQIQERDQGFYRMEKDKNGEFSKNDAMLLGYNGMTHYSSTFHAGVNVFTGGLGIAQAHIWNSGYGSSVLTDSIFNVKYRMVKEKLPESYKQIDTQDDVYIYENTKVLPIAFAAGQTDTMDFTSSNNFRNQNDLLNALAGTDQVEYFRKLDYKEENGSGSNWGYSLTADSDNPVYLRMFGNIGWATVSVNDHYVGNHFSSETNCNLYLGQFQAGEKIKIKCESGDVLKTDELMYEMDLNAFEQAYEKLSKGGLEITKQKGSTIEGTIQVGKDQMIFTSIPYDSGYTVKVDGKKVQPQSLKVKNNEDTLDVFLTIPAGEGTHTISISYLPPGFGIGMFLAALAVLASLVYYKSDLLKKRAKGSDKQ